MRPPARGRQGPEEPECLQSHPLKYGVIWFHSVPLNPHPTLHNEELVSKGEEANKSG